MVLRSGLREVGGGEIEGNEGGVLQKIARQRES